MAKAPPETAAVTGAEALVRMLALHGVEYLFGLCGDTSLPFYDALCRLRHGMTHVLTRDERSAAYMADGYARASGRVGVCEGPSGGGATYILPGVAEANASSVPLLCVTTDISVSSRDRYTLTELDQEALFRPVTKSTRVIDRGDQIPSAVRGAFHAMTTGRPGAVHLGVPLDVQREHVDVAQLHAGSVRNRAPGLRPAPDPASIRAAAALLMRARRPALIVGGGVLIAGGSAELGKLAESLGALVCTTVSGKGSLADTHPLMAGVIGSNGGTPATRALIDDADAIMFIGCRAGSVTTEKWRHPLPGKVHVVHVDVDPGVFNVNYPTDVEIHADAKLALRALCDELGARPSWRRRSRVTAQAVARAKTSKFSAFRRLASSHSRPITPERIVAALRSVLDDDATLVADPGTPCPYLSAYYELRRAGRYFLSNRAHGALGYAMPAAVGAHFARPATRTVAIMGDGSFGFTCGELETIVRLRVPLLMIVVSNATYGWIKAGQRSGFAGRYFSVDFGKTDHAAVAEAFGVRSWRVSDPAKLQPALMAALRHAGPSLVDVIAQPLHLAHAPVSEWIV
jgi:acetolactate synthase-1/2/3 large subunit